MFHLEKCFIFALTGKYIFRHNSTYRIKKKLKNVNENQI